MDLTFGITYPYTDVRVVILGMWYTYGVLFIPRQQSCAGMVGYVGKVVLGFA